MLSCNTLHKSGTAGSRAGRIPRKHVGDRNRCSSKVAGKSGWQRAQAGRNCSRCPQVRGDIPCPFSPCVKYHYSRLCYPHFNYALWFLISYAQRVHEDELPIEVGDVLRLVEESEDPGWFFAVNEYTGARGTCFEKSSLPSTTRQPCRRGLWLIHEQSYC